MAGEDVKVKIGVDAAPYQVGMAKVKMAAKETAESLGIEFDRGAARTERRMGSMIGTMIKEVSKAKNPIEAIHAAIEGIGYAAGIASTAFLVAGIGAAIYEQFSDAIEASDKLEKSLAKLSAVDVENESVNQLKKDIEDFQQVEEKYKNRGLLEKILFGGKEDRDFTAATALNEVKKDLVEMQQIQDDVVRSRARVLETSTNPGERAQGANLLKGLSDRGESNDLNEQLRQAEAAQKENIGKMHRLGVLIATPVSEMTWSEKSEMQSAESYTDIAKSIEDGEKKINEIKQAQIELQQAQTAEGNKAANEELDRFNKEQASKTSTAAKHQLEIEEQIGDAGRTAQEKPGDDWLRQRNDQQAQDAFVGPRTSSEVIEDQNKILEDQLRIKKDIVEAGKADAEAARKNKEQEAKKLELASRLKEMKNRRDNLLLEQKSEQAAALKAGADAMGFHGAVSSLRREGFGRTPTGSGNSSQLKAAQEANAKLDKVNKELAELNAKIGGSV